MVNKRAIVYGCGKIFDNHYRDAIFCCFSKVVLIDPRFSDTDFSKKYSKKAKAINPSIFVDCFPIQPKIIYEPDTYFFIFTPHKTHYNLILNALYINPLGIYIEKPVVLTLKNWRHIENVAENYSSTIWPAYHHFFTSFHDILKKNIGVLDINDVRKINVDFIRGTVPVRPWGDSFTSLEYAGGGVLLDIGPHVFSILSTLITNIHLYQLDVVSRELKNASKLSQLETLVNFNGRISNLDCLINAKIGYDTDGKKTPRKISIELKDLTEISWIEGDLYINNVQVHDKRPYSALAFKAMFFDFIQGKVFPLSLIHI